MRVGLVGKQQAADGVHADQNPLPQRTGAHRSKCLSADVSGLVFKHSGQAKICQLGNEATWISGGRLEQDVLWLQVPASQQLLFRDGSQIDKRHTDLMVRYTKTS